MNLLRVPPSQGDVRKGVRSRSRFESRLRVNCRLLCYVMSHCKCYIMQVTSMLFCIAVGQLVSSDFEADYSRGSPFFAGRQGAGRESEARSALACSSLNNNNNNNNNNSNNDNNNNEKKKKKKIHTNNNVYNKKKKRILKARGGHQVPELLSALRQR